VSPMLATYPAYLYPLDLIKPTMFCLQYNLTMLLFLVSRLFFPVRSKYFPKHPVLILTKLVFLDLSAITHLHMTQCVIWCNQPIVWAHVSAYVCR
jgi:hypothetical protein